VHVDKVVVMAFGELVRVWRRVIDAGLYVMLEMGFRRWRRGRVVIGICSVRQRKEGEAED
jgi:hypothetical protein